MDTRSRVFGADVRVIGEWEPEERMQYVTAVSDGVRGAFRPSDDLLTMTVAAGRGARDPWEFAEHHLGFFGGAGDGPDSHGNYPIRPAGQIQPEGDLARINVRLDRLRIFDYPGRGPHHVLLTFKAMNTTEEGLVEGVAFNQTFVVPGGEGAGVIGYPIFIGLNVGQEGANFAVGTVNVKNGDDERALAVLDSTAVQQGLTLLSVAQPALKPFTDLAVNLGRFLLNRHKNVAVQQFFMGLDRQQGAVGGARLRRGSYVALQGPDVSWDDWIFNPQKNCIVSASDHTSEVPLNYFIFRVSSSG